MKTKSFIPILVIGLISLLWSSRLYSQDSIALKSQMLDIKLQLLDSKLELLDTKIKLWEAKPKELDIKLTELNSKIKSMDFQPQEMKKKITELDSIIRMKPVSAAPAEYIREVKEQEPAPEIQEYTPVYNSSIMLDPVRLLEGTFCLSYERVIDPRFTINLSALATYSTKQGLSNYYFSNQEFSFLNSMTNQFQRYKGEVMSGGGFNIQLRNYLLANHPGRKTAPLGLYAAPQFMYRNMKITGYYQEMEPVEESDPVRYELVNKEIVQNLNIFAGGAVLGIKIPLFKVLAIDIFAGGNIRLSKYQSEKGFTKYKDWFNIDFSGVSPVAGIAIGILK